MLDVTFIILQASDPAVTKSEWRRTQPWSLSCSGVFHDIFQFGPIVKIINVVGVNNITPPPLEPISQGHKILGIYF